MQQNFKKHFLYLARAKGPGSLQSKMLYKFLTGDAIFNDDVKHFWKITEIIFNSEEFLGPARIKYLRQMWSIKEKWTAAFAPRTFIAGTHTTSRGEAVNAQVKTKIHSKSTLVDILQMMQELDERVVDRCESDFKHVT